MRFRRLTGIGDFGYFQQWTDTEKTRPHSFGTRTVIFGSNGSGKSTMADIFRAIELAQREDGVVDPRLANVTVELTDGDGAIKHRANGAELPPVLVYNRAYVEANLRGAFESSDGLGAPLYVLGEKAGGLDAELEAVDARLRELADALPGLKKREGETRRRVERSIEAVKKDVNERLGSYDERYQPYRFKRNDAEVLLEGSADELDAQELETASRDLGAAREQVPDDRELPGLPQLAPLDERLATLAELDVTSRTIDRLAADHRLASWAQKGLEFHEPGDRCAFCDSTVQQSRIEDLRAHFDDSYRDLQATAEQLDGQLAEAEEELDATLEALRALANDGGGVADKISESADRLEAYGQQARSWLSAGRELVRQRQIDPFGEVAWEAPPSPDRAVFEELAEVAATENAELRDRRENTTSIRKQAAERLRRHIAAKHAVEYQTAVQEFEAAQREHAGNTDEHTELGQQRAHLIAQARAAHRDGRHLAEQLTDDLHAYLGHRQLTVEFRPSEEPPGFAFLRNGEPAIGLSEGERGAVSLLYFLRALDSDEISSHLPQMCIVIDDPVSSFDQDALLAAFSFLRRRLRGDGGGLRCAQVVILTHNFEFFRLWKDALDSATRSDRDAARRAECDVDQLWGRKAALLELRATATDPGLTLRRSMLRELGHGQAGSSEYYLLFQRVCEATLPEHEHAALLAGNAARRLLESFLRWKLPHKTNFTEAIDQLGRQHNVPSVTRERVTRALHGASHREEVEITSSAYVGDIVDHLRATLAFMEVVDPQHYDGMREATQESPDLHGFRLPRSS